MTLNKCSAPHLCFILFISHSVCYLGCFMMCCVCQLALPSSDRRRSSAASSLCASCRCPGTVTCVPCALCRRRCCRRPRLCACRAHSGRSAAHTTSHAPLRRPCGCAAVCMPHSTLCSRGCGCGRRCRCSGAPSCCASAVSRGASCCTARRTLSSTATPSSSLSSAFPTLSVPACSCCRTRICNRGITLSRALLLCRPRCPHILPVPCRPRSHWQ